MKKLMLIVIKFFLIIFTAFGCLGIFVMMKQSDRSGTLIYTIWTLIGFILLVILFKRPKQSNKSVPDTIDNDSNVVSNLHDSPPQKDETVNLPRKTNIILNNTKEAPPPSKQSIETSTSSPASEKQEHLKIAGTSFRQKEIESLGSENIWYDCSKKELIDDFMIDERVYQYDFFPDSVELIEEPDNPHDPNAIKVIIDNVHVCYIKKGSCAHVKKLLHQNKIIDITADISGGKYKYISTDYDVENDKDIYVLEKHCVDYSVSLDLTLKQ